MKFVSSFTTALVALVTFGSTALAVDKICEGHTGKDTLGKPFAHPTMCGYFVTCGSDGKAYLGTCPAGTYYDIKLTTCTGEAKSSCGDRKTS
ncbi:hypothetical protein J3B02_004585 [Coemansia erecta]|uniref:Chitin-binding type-2 domain-containing protein n=1 Tax=Coemansia asiatica TaxID=1052880 RepID=A0A9W8CHM3_9FUNG|nr:hypothetical protein LPJ64_004706 [Coemansia asiatica]KAJ2845785.1 hypothetical protein J3B02_004585 [Coemansia erecta]